MSLATAVIYRTSLKLSKVVAIVEGDLKGTVSITATPRGGATPFPGLLYFTFDTHLIMTSVKQVIIVYHFLIFDITQHVIERHSPGLLVKTLHIRPNKRHKNTQVWIINIDDKSSTLTNECTCKGYISFAIYTDLMMAQDRPESTRDPSTGGLLTNSCRIP